MYVINFSAVWRIFSKESFDKIEGFIYSDKFADGGAAMAAYAKMQFMNISQEEHNAIANGLLKYC